LSHERRLDSRRPARDVPRVISDVPDLDESYGRTTARFYDAAYGDNPNTGRDADFYRALARECAGPVLELGCGTGRVLLRIAGDGFPCTGLDASRHMLDALRTKSTFPNLRLVHAPMQRFDLGADRFGLVYAAFRVFQHLYTVEDQLACLACVRRHLAPGGRFAFDVFAPRLERMGRPEEPEQLELRFEQDGESVARYATVWRDRVAQLLSVRFRYERSRNGEVLGNEEARFSMRWFWRYELEHLLARAGFAEVEIYGDFDRRPVGPDTPAFIAVAR
jgi:SAM-dependent methyltransferase